MSEGVPPFGDEGDTDFARELSLLDVTFIGVGAMIGGSIFVLSGLAAGEAGPALILAFALNGFVTIFTGMTYAELGSAFPEPGGGYLWVRTALGRSQAFLSGWMSWFAHAVAGSLYILSFGSFVTLILTRFLGVSFGLSPVVLQKLFAVIAAAGFTYVNYRGTKETSVTGTVVTALQLAILALFIAAGFVAIADDPGTLRTFEPFFPNGFGGVFIAMGLTFIAFEGYEIIVQSGREVVDPRENIPKAVFYSLLVVVTIYILVGAVLLGAVDITPPLLETARETSSIGGETVGELPPDPALWQVLGHLGEFGLAQAAGQLLPYGALVILVTGILSSLAALNATTFSSSRVGYALGNDNVFPSLFGRIHAENRTPHVSVLFSGALIAAIAVAFPLQQVAAATDLMFLLLFLQVNYSNLRLRREYGDVLDYGYVAPLFPYVPIAGILLNLGLAAYFVTYSPVAGVIVIGWIAAGLAVFATYSRGRIRETEIARETRLVSEERSPRERPYQVLVPIAHPENAARLVRIASAVARRNNGEILLTTVATVPIQTPLEESRRDVSAERDLLADAMAHVPPDVPAHRTVTLGRNPGPSIVNIATQRDSELIVLGWRGRRSRLPGYVLGSTIDEVVERAPCDVVVAKTPNGGPTRNVLVPTAGGPHARFAEEIAAAFAAQDGANVTVMTVSEEAGDGDDAEALVRRRRDELAEAGVEATTAVVSGADVPGSILRYADEHEIDTVVIGGTREGILQRALFGDVPEAIGERFDGRVLIAKKFLPFRSNVVRWARRWFARRPRDDGGGGGRDEIGGDEIGGDEIDRDGGR